LAGFVYTIIIKIISKADSHVKNSFKFVKKLDSRRLIDEFQLMELLVSSLTFPVTMRWTVSKTIGDLFLEIVVYLTRNSSKRFNLF